MAHILGTVWQVLIEGSETVMVTTSGPLFHECRPGPDGS